jgi:hypothetical protein
MAKRGVFQLKELTLHYCRRGGSSEGTRQFIERDLAAWAAKNPQIEIRTQERNGRHPYLHGAYCKRTRSAPPTHGMHDAICATCSASAREDAEHKKLQQ